jgi:hypothetical protein
MGSPESSRFPEWQIFTETQIPHQTGLGVNLVSLTRLGGRLHRGVPRGMVVILRCKMLAGITTSL